MSWMSKIMGLAWQYQDEVTGLQKHVQASAREAFEAVDTVVQLAQKVCEQQGLSQKTPWMMALFVKWQVMAAGFMTRFGASNPAAQEAQSVKKQAFQSIVSVLDGEIERLGLSRDNDAVLQLKALVAIRKTLLDHLEERVINDPQTHSEHDSQPVLDVKMGV